MSTWRLAMWRFTRSQSLERHTRPRPARSSGWLGDWSCELSRVLTLSALVIERLDDRRSLCCFFFLFSTFRDQVMIVVWMTLCRQTVIGRRRSTPPVRETVEGVHVESRRKRRKKMLMDGGSSLASSPTRAGQDPASRNCPGLGKVRVQKEKKKDMRAKCKSKSRS